MTSTFPLPSEPADLLPSSSGVSANPPSNTGLQLHTGQWDKDFLFSPACSEDTVFVDISSVLAVTSASEEIPDNISPTYQNTCTTSRFESRIDWLQGIFSSGLEEIVNEFSELFSTSFTLVDESFTSGQRYERYHVSTCGIKILHSDKARHLVIIPGKPLATLNFVSYCRLLFFLSYHDFQCTRIDCTVDDFLKLVRPRDIYERVAIPHNYKGLRSYDFRTHFTGKSGSEAGDTLYLGSSSGNKRMTIYDKFIESEGEINSVRYESRFRDEAGHIVFIEIINYLASDESDSQGFSQCLSSLCFGICDFIDRSANPCVSRCPRLRIYQILIDICGYCRLPYPKKVDDIKRKVNWMVATWKRSLAIIDTLSASFELTYFIDTLIEKGHDCLTRRDIDYCKKFSDFDVSGYLYSQFGYERKTIDSEGFFQRTSKRYYEGVHATA